MPFYLTPKQDDFNKIPQLQVCIAEALYDVNSIVADVPYDYNGCNSEVGQKRTAHHSITQEDKNAMAVRAKHAKR